MGMSEAGGVSSKRLLTDEQWALMEPLLPPQRSGRVGVGRCGIAARSSGA